MLPHNSNTYNEILASSQGHVMANVVLDMREISAKLVKDLVIEDDAIQKTILQGKLRLLADLIEDYTRQPRNSHYSTTDA